MPTTPAVVSAKCTRCGRRLRDPQAPGWNVTAKAGVIVGFLCPTCQTVEENAEAEINDATVTYATGEDGLIRTNPRV